MKKLFLSLAFVIGLIAASQSQDTITYSYTGRCIELYDLLFSDGTGKKDHWNSSLFLTLTGTRSLILDMGDRRTEFFPL